MAGNANSGRRVDPPLKPAAMKELFEGLDLSESKDNLDFLVRIDQARLTGKLTHGQHQDMVKSCNVRRQIASAREMDKRFTEIQKSIRELQERRGSTASLRHVGPPPDKEEVKAGLDS